MLVAAAVVSVAVVVAVSRVCVCVCVCVLSFFSLLVAATFGSSKLFFVQLLSFC